MSKDDKNPREISGEEAREINDQLELDDYKPKALAAKYQRKFGAPERRELLDGIAIWAMSLGHIALAEEMAKLGANPKASIPAGFSMNGFGYYRPQVDKSPSIPYLLANQGKRRSKLPKLSDSSLIRTRVEVLEHVLANAQRWNADVNQTYDGNAPLIVARAKHNSYSRWARSYRPIHDPMEIIEFQEALIEAGANVNPRGVNHNLLEANIPDYSMEEVDLTGLDRALAWGVDIASNAPSAWARAIRQDVDVRYTKKAAIGARAQALRDRGIPLLSPVDAHWQSSPLLQAVELGMRPVVLELIENGTDPCWVDPSNGDNLLICNYDPKGNTLDMLRLFPKGSFDKVINGTARDGDTALHRAVNALNAPMVKFLLEQGADVHALNAKKQKPLQAMRRSGDKAQEKFDEVLGVLLEYGVDMGADKKSSAMHKAARLLSAKAVSHLAGEGHSPNVLDSQRHSPAELVVTGHQAHDASYFNPKRGVAQVKTLQALVEAGVDIGVPLKNGSTLLHEAVLRGAHLVAVYLLENGVDPHVKNSNGDMAMHVWTQDSRASPNTTKPKNEPYIMELVDAFIRAGADMDLLDRSGNLPFQKARELPGVQATLERSLLQRSTPAAEPPNTTSQRRMRL